MNDLTDNQKREYIEQPNQCPFCHHDIKGTGLEIDADSAWQEMTCSNCNSSWRNFYVLVDIET